ncbi:hypothetical protein Lesp02_64780 [Lentzea sp. NBRC 105346]|uniref:hypothetical protein n=1 Tax=Lentzea sp. NBRC 105346 TaxID=3032205 RepID=UPI0024A5306A|nr:hypothetical protein [Lentzea sp. NBRC 105346]GLZ34291.1 hypothetical protein Lesp02_64780 [Lentzea sp. NBRC 105346]
MRRLLGALVAVLLLAGSSQPVAGRSVDELLRQRTEAVLTHNEAMFTAGIDPDASEPFKAAQQRLFRNVTALPITTWRYDRDHLTYALDVDQRPTTKPLTFRFTEHAGRWYIADDKPALPWDFAPIRVDRTMNGLVISHPGDEALAARVLAELDPAVDAVTEVWGSGWPRKVAVVIPHNPDELRELVGPVLSDVAGIAISDAVDPPAGQRVVINPDQAAPLSPVELRVLIRHEFTHVAARQATRDTAPMWLVEGFADYVAFHGSGMSLRQAAPLLTSDVAAVPTDFAGPKRDLAYQQAYSLCLYLAQHQDIAAFYRSHQSQVDIDVTGWREFLRQAIG